MRGFIRWTFCLLFLSASFGGLLSAQSSISEESLRVVLGTPREKDAQQMLPRFLLQLAGDATERRRARLEAIRSEADFREWQETNRNKFLALIGGLPAEHAPLNARVVGEVAREGYVIRKIIFESLPEYYVTANLYVPTAGQGPFAAVLAPCGHSANGKAYDVYQHLFIGLVKRGYVVLTYDPMGQGERFQYWDFIHHQKFLEGPDNQHAMAGLQGMLLGQNLARYFIWDGIRGLDYLSSLPEVDAQRLGVTGNSGGGTLTTYISMLDPRVKAAAIVTYLTSIPQKIQARALDAEADPEQDIPGLLAEGLDHTEFVGMIAPRPVMIGAATRDFFPIEGTHETFAELQGLYRKLGAAEKIALVEFDHRHMYSRPLREAAYAWFDRWLKGIENHAPEPPIVTEKDETLQCTATGQVMTSLGGKRVYDFNRAEAERRLDNLDQRRSGADFRAGLAGRIRGRLALPGDAPSGKAEKLGEAEAGDLLIEKWRVESEPGIELPVRVIKARGRPGRLPAVVYLRDRLGEADSAALFESLARQGKLVAVADVRGFGETWAPRTVREVGADYFQPRDGRDADFAYAANFLGRPLLGMRVWDALNVVQYVRSRPDVDHVALAGRGIAGLVALLACAVDSKLTGAAVEGIPVSYGAIAQANVYDQPASILLPGVLFDFDLPDLFGVHLLLVVNPQDPLGRKMYETQGRDAVFKGGASSQDPPAGRNLEVRVAPYETDVPKMLERWLLAH